MGKTYVYAEDMERILKDRFIEEVRTALKDFDPKDQDARGVVAAIGGMMILMDKSIEDLNHEEEAT